MKNNSVQLYDNRLTIFLPDGFQETEPSAIHFQAAAPDHVYLELSGRSVITVTLTENQMRDDQLETHLAEYCRMYRWTVPGFDHCKMARTTTASGKEVGAFQYASTSPEGTLLNLFAISSLDGRELVFTMHSNLENVMDTARKFMEVLNSAQIGTAC